MSSVAVATPSLVDESRWRTGRMTAGAWLLAVLLAAEAGAWGAWWPNHTPRALLLLTILGFGLLPVAARVLMNRPVRMARLRPAYVAVLLVWAAVGLVGAAMGLLYGNKPFYMLADIYHWYVVALLLAVMTAAVLGNGSAQDAARTVAVAGVLVGLACVAVFVVGSLRIVKMGYYVKNLGIARLIVGQDTPQIIMVIVTAALWRWKLWDRRTRGLLLIGMILLTIALAATLKRTQWLSFPITAMIVMLPRRVLRVCILAGVMVGVTGLAVLAVSDAQPDELLSNAADALTYNPRFTVQETLLRRVLAMETTLPYVQEHPYGYGLGAAVYSYSPRKRDLTEMHYMNSLYAYYLLQVGVVMSVVLAGLAGWLGWSWWKLHDRDSEWNFAVRAGLACLVVIVLNGVTLMTTRTVFFGFAVGLGMIGATKVRAHIQPGEATR